MSRPLFVLVAAILLHGCGPSIIRHAQEPIGTADKLEGLYGAEIETEVGTYWTRIAVRDNGAAFLANSPSGGLSRAVGGFSGWVGELASASRYPGGVLVRWTGERAEGNETVRFVTPMFSADGDWVRLGTNELRDDGRTVARLRLEVIDEAFDPAIAVRDLSVRIRSAFEAQLFDPAELESKATQAFLRRLDELAVQAVDEMEFAFGFLIAARELPYSHVSLVRETERRRRGETPLSGDTPAMLVGFEDEGAALRLTFASFGPGGADAAAIDTAFGQVGDQAPPALMLDLRDHPGGTYHALRVAAHLLDAPAVAGALVGRAGRDAALAGRLDGFPEIDGVASVAALETMIDEHGGIVGRVEPAAVRYDGPVVVLVNGNTASAAEPLADLLQRTGRATVIGTTTAGAMLSAREIDLGDGWMLRLPVFDFVTADGRRLEGEGVAPDVEADDALAAALEALGR